MADVQYLHPHISSHIVDNSAYTEVISSPGGTVLFQPLIADRGEDNVIMRLSSEKELFAKFGFPNFKEHGQSIYNAWQWLRGRGIVNAVRVLPNDAKFANVVLNIKTKIVTETLTVRKAVLDADGNAVYENGLPKFVQAVDPISGDPLVDDLGSPVYETETTEQKRMVVKVETSSSDQLTSIASIKSQLDLLNNAVSNDGFKNHYLFAVVPKGRGKYGNNFGMNMKLNIAGDETYSFRSYDLELFERLPNGSTQTLDTLIFSLFPEALDLGGMSLFMPSIISEYSSDISCTFSEKAYDMLINDLMEINEGDQEIFESPQEIDFLFGLNRKLAGYTLPLDCAAVKRYPDLRGYSKLMINFDETVTEYPLSAALDRDRVAFKFGTDGSFEMSNADRARALESVFSEVYYGFLIPEVQNKEMYPFDVVLDAGYPLPVKEAMADFCKYRKDVFGITDTGLIPSATSAINWRKNSFTQDTFLLALFGQAQVVFDPFTGKDIQVTSTYFLANKIPSNDADFGIHKPFVGPQRGAITGMKSINYNPSNPLEKDELIKNRINYIEQLDRQTRFNTQLTSQSKNSALSNINNVRTLLRMVREGENIAQNFMHEYADDVIEGLQKELDNNYASYRDTACERVDVTVYQKGQDRVRKIVRVKVEVVFKALAERIIMEFSVSNS